MEAVGGEPCETHLEPVEVTETDPLDEPSSEQLGDCSPLKNLGTTLHSLLLAGAPMPSRRGELGLGEVSYLDADPLPMAGAAAPTNGQPPAGCSVLMGYLCKPDDPAGRHLSPVRHLSPADSDIDDPGEPPTGTEADGMSPPPPLSELPDLSQTCLVCGVTATRGRSRTLHGADPLPASGSAYLAFVGSLLGDELEPTALERLQVVCLDCHDLLVTIDDLEQRVTAMKNSVRSQFRAWWRAGADGSSAAASASTEEEPDKRRRSSRRVTSASRQALNNAGHADATEADQATDDEYRPNKRRKTKNANAPKPVQRRAKTGTYSEKRIEKSKNLVCTQCPFYTFDRDTLRAHIASVHAGEKAHSCEVCQKRFTYEDSLKRHMNQHQHFIKEFRCEPCGEQFVNRSELLLHRQLYMHGAQAADAPAAVADGPAPAAALDVGDFAIQFTCPDCGLLHTMRDNEKEQVLACACGRQFDLAAALHLFPGKYGSSCLACGHQCDDHDQMESHLTEAHGNGDILCLSCGCCYSQLDHFKLHALFHSTLSEHACGQCSFRTYNPTRMAEHRHPAPAPARRGDEEEAIVAAVRANPPARRGRPRKDAPQTPTYNGCPICGKELSSLTNLKNHMVLHSDVHEHKCPVCGRRFKLRKYLNTHLTLHTGVRQFKCTICEKDFNQKCELNRHMRYHNGDMKHVCEFCGKRFREANGLKFHLQTHTGERPFACDQCGIALRSATKLRIHQRKHTGEKPYKCEYCGKDFAYKYNFDCHLRLHTGDRRFRCSFCQTGFERRDKLQAHQQSCSRRMETAAQAVDATGPPQQAPQPLAVQDQPAPPPADEPHPYPWSMEELQPH